MCFVRVRTVYSCVFYDFGQEQKLGRTIGIYYRVYMIGLSWSTDVYGIYLDHPVGPRKITTSA